MSKGGAIYYDLYRPLDFNSNYFNENLASYGKNIGSFPFKLKLLNEKQEFLQNLSSGQQIQDTIQIAVIDQDQQIVVDLPESLLSITSDDLSIQIAGETSVMSINGVFVFKNIKIIGKPQSNTTLNFKTSSIDEDILFKVSGNKDSTLPVQVGFRKCLRGEVLQNNQCLLCQKGQYSLNPGDKSCKACPSNAKCEGGAILQINDGYWRNSTDSANIMRCFKSGVCLQAFISLKYIYFRGGYDSSCVEGYEGKLCTQCQKQTQSGKIFARSSQYTCSECLDIEKQGLILASIIIALGIYIFYIHQILTNYFQVVMLVKDFQLNWPPQVLSMLEYFSIGGQGFSQVLSFECFLKNAQLSTQISLIYLQVILAGLLPFILSMITLIVWILFYFSKRIQMTRQELKRNIKTSFVLFGFLCYPQISSQAFSLFSCLQFENGKSYLRQDMQIECWTKDHMNMMFMIGITFIIFYSFAFPAFIFTQLFLSKKKLSDKTIVTQYGLFYSGLKDEYYYWEVLYVNIKKLFFIIFASLLSTFNSYIRISTLFGGILFLNDDVQESSIALTAVFVLVLLVNVTFLANWVATFFKVIVRTNFKRITTLLVFLKRYNIKSYEDDLKLRQKVKSQKIENNQDALQIENDYKIQNQSSRMHDITNILSISQIDQSSRHLMSQPRGINKQSEKVDQTINEKATFKFKLRNKKKQKSRIQQNKKSSLSKNDQQQRPRISDNQQDQSTFLQSKVKSVRFDNTTSQYLTDRDQDNDANAQIFTTKNQLIKNEDPFLQIKKSQTKNAQMDKLKLKFKM
eukprot:403357498